MNATWRCTWYTKSVLSCSKTMGNDMLIYMSIIYVFPQSSRREISEHLQCWRTPGMLSHTEDFNLDYRGKCRYFIQSLVAWVNCGSAWANPPKRITENPSLIHWSIHTTSTVPKTSHSKGHVILRADSLNITLWSSVVFRFPCFNLCFFIYISMSTSATKMFIIRFRMWSPIIG